MNEVTQLKKLMETVQLNEYIFKGPTPMSELIVLNLFSDAEERPSEYEEEFAEDEEWMKIEALYYDRIVPRMEKAMMASDKILDDDEVEEAEAAYYDGSDSYESVWMAIDNLPELYDAQIEFIDKLLGM